MKQFLAMSGDWDTPWATPANQQGYRYRFEGVMGYSPGFDQYLPGGANAWLGPIAPFIYIDLLAVYAALAPWDDPNVIPNITKNPDWVLHDASGKPLFLNYACASGKCPQYIADVTNAGFIDRQVSRVQALVSLGAGAFLDDVNPKNCITDGSGQAIAAANLPAGVTIPKFSRGVARLVEIIRARVPGIKIAHNLSYDSTSPSDAIDRCIAACDLVNIEGGFGEPHLPSTLDIFGEVDRIHQAKRNFICDEIVSTNLDYQLNCFRLVADPGDFVGYVDMLTEDPRMLVETGAAIGPRMQTGPTTYRRQFTGGWASVDIQAKTGVWQS